MIGQTLDNERFFVEYSNGESAFTMYWNINDKHISQFWKKTLISNYIGIDNQTSYALLDKRFMNKGFPKTKDQPWSRNVQQICDELNDAIEVINTRLTDFPTITQHFTPERCWTPDLFRDDFNQLHHHFEVLIGQTWSVSKWYEIMDNHTRWATHCLNNACHEIESYVHAISPGHGDFESYGWTGISYNSFCWDGVKRKERIKYYYEDKHSNDWGKSGILWGALVPYYAQTGKTLREVFEDGDEYIDETGISQHCIMVGEVQICLTGPGNELDLYRMDEESGFIKWLEDKGYDYNDPKTGVGDAVMGMPAFELFPDDSWQSLDIIIKECDNITAVGFVDSDLNIIENKSTRYDYTWQEQYTAEKLMFSKDHNSRSAPL